MIEVPYSDQILLTKLHRGLSKATTTLGKFGDANSLQLVPWTEIPSLIDIPRARSAHRQRSLLSFPYKEQLNVTAKHLGLTPSIDSVIIETIVRNGEIKIDRQTVKHIVNKKDDGHFECAVTGSSSVKAPAWKEVLDFP